VSRVHGPVDCYSGRSTVDSRPGRGGALTGAWRAAATKGGSSPRKYLEKEGTKGNLTATLVGAKAARFGRATARQSGGGPSSVGVQYGCAWSEPMQGMGRWCGDGALWCLLQGGDGGREAVGE
jgi:hypothetical protein